MCRVPYLSLPFDIALADLSWEFTLFGDVDVSTESLGLPDIPADLALKLSWVGEVAVTQRGPHTYSSTFEYAAVVTAALNLETTGAIEVQLMVGRDNTSMVCPIDCLCVILCSYHMRLLWDRTSLVCLIGRRCVILGDPATSLATNFVAPTTRAKRRFRRRASTGSSWRGT